MLSQDAESGSNVTLSQDATESGSVKVKCADGSFGYLHLRSSVKWDVEAVESHSDYVHLRVSRVSERAASSSVLS